MTIKKSEYKGVFYFNRKPATVASYKGKVYDEKIVKEKKKYYRIWEPSRSKLGAAIMKKIKRVPIKEGDTVLYLGSASGTTASHISDIVGREGIVYCVEFSPRVMRDFLFNCENRTNMMPILANASLPQDYNFIGKVDVIYQDVAQPDQTRILLNNIRRFLKKGGYWLLCVKARSINVSEEPEKVFKEVKKELLEKELKIIDEKRLEPYEKDHIIFLGSGN